MSKISFPYTNPIVFDQYINNVRQPRIYDESVNNGQSKPFIQYFYNQDRLTFQILWDTVPLVVNETIFTINFYRDDSLLFSQEVWTTSTGGTSGNLANKFVQRNNFGRSSSGVYTFQHDFVNTNWLRIFKKNGTTQDVLLRSSGCYHVEVVDKWGNVWISNDFQVTNDVTFFVNLKSILYKNTSTSLQRIQDTYFAELTFPFTIWLPIEIVSVTPSSDNSIFIDNEGRTTLIQGLPLETIKLTIGGKTGIPRMYQRMLNAIFACDTKQLSISGISGGHFPFELATGSQLQIDNIAGYALDFYSCEVVEKTRPFSYYFETNF